MAIIRFLNVDVDLEGTDLGELILVLGPNVSVLHHTGQTASLELMEQPSDPEFAIQRFGNLINSLSARNRAIWDSCSLRRFDIGIAAGSQPHALHLRLDLKTLEVVNRLRAEVAITVYAAETGADAGLA